MFEILISEMYFIRLDPSEVFLDTIEKNTPTLVHILKSVMFVSRSILRTHAIPSLVYAYRISQKKKKITDFLVFEQQK